jgi:hypothetical protein
VIGGWAWGRLLPSSGGCFGVCGCLRLSCRMTPMPHLPPPAPPRKGESRPGLHLTPPWLHPPPPPGCTSPALITPHPTPPRIWQAAPCPRPRARRARYTVNCLAVPGYRQRPTENLLPATARYLPRNTKSPPFYRGALLLACGAGLCRRAARPN